MKKIAVCGLMVMMMLTPISRPVEPYMIEAQAAETYSDNWKMDGAGVWWYYMSDGSVARDCWIHDMGHWYLSGSDGAMRTGIFKSNGNRYYLLDTVRGTGTYGKLLKNGEVYQGITLNCDTSAEYEGALSDGTIQALKSAGIDFGSVPSVENTKHVENGQVTSGATNTGSTDGSSSAEYNQMYEDYMKMNKAIDEYTAKQAEPYIKEMEKYYEEMNRRD